MTNFDPNGYDYYIAQNLPSWALDEFDEELREMAGKFEHLQIPVGQYLICETKRCHYPTNMVDSLHKQAVSGWLPTSGYELRDTPKIGIIHWFWGEGNNKLNHSRYCELWLPIAKKA